MDNQVTSNYVYDSDRVIAEYDNSGSLICEYVYGNSIDEVLFMIKGNDFYYYHYDSLGSVRAITDGSEAIVETYTYDVYGRPTLYDNQQEEITTSSIGNRFYFTGREYDFASGLYYYRTRYYNPILGRFISPDPGGLIDGPNMYTYVNNNSVNLVDSFGLFSGKMTTSARTLLYRDYARRKIGEWYEDSPIGRQLMSIGDAIAAALAAAMGDTETAKALLTSAAANSGQAILEESNATAGDYAAYYGALATSVGATAIAAAAIAYEAATGIRIEGHGPHARGPHNYPHLQGIKGPGWGTTVWRFP